MTLENGRGRAPRPDTWFTRRTVAWRRAIARTVAACNRGLDRLPPLRACYRWQLERGLACTRVPWPLPAASAPLAGTRAAFLSDVHLGSYVTPGDLARVCDRINEQAPDLVLIGGDTVHTRPAEIDWLIDPLARLRAPLGVFAVPGNHERYPGIDLERWSSRLGSIGIEVLRDRGVRIERSGAGFWLAGVDDLTEGAPDVESAFSGRTPGEPALVLSHHPDLFPEIVPRAPVMVLSGHTHGGQIAPFGRILMRHSLLGFDRGLHVHGLARLYVGRGIGASIVPLRIGAPPEVPIVEMVVGEHH